MVEFFKDIFKYHHHYNQELVDLLHMHKDRISERSIPLLSHMINAHQIWNARILGLEPLGVDEVHSLDRIKALDTSSLKDTRRVLDERELASIITYTNSKGEEFSNSVQEILFHAANHHTHHRGQIISDLRQHGIDPLVTDYIFYKR